LTYACVDAHIRIIEDLEKSHLLNTTTAEKYIRRSGDLSASTHQAQRPMTLRPRLTTGLPFRHFNYSTPHEKGKNIPERKMRKGYKLPSRNISLEN
jgi:hypothetical protein